MDGDDSESWMERLGIGQGFFLPELSKKFTCDSSASLTTTCPCCFYSKCGKADSLEILIRSHAERFVDRNYMIDIRHRPKEVLLR